VLSPLEGIIMPEKTLKKILQEPLAGGDLQALNDHLAEHTLAKQLRRSLTEIAFYPPHPKRRETPEYKAIHNQLVKKEDRACLVCGVKNSTLQTKANVFGAKQMETHHRIIEWALANAIDANKFNKRVLPGLARARPLREDYKKPFTDDQVKAWVDHDPDNLWVLCDVHHRAKFFGIHQITYPIWGPTDLLRDDFDEYARKELQRAAAAEKKNPKMKPGT
jgi:hypothetical protein